MGKAREKQAKKGENRQKHAKTGVFLVLIFWGGKLVGANFYAFCNYEVLSLIMKSRESLICWKVRAMLESGRSERNWAGLRSHQMLNRPSEKKLQQNEDSDFDYLKQF